MYKKPHNTVLFPGFWELGIWGGGGCIIISGSRFCPGCRWRMGQKTVTGEGSVWEFCVYSPSHICWQVKVLHGAVQLRSLTPYWLLARGPPQFFLLGSPARDCWLLPEWASAWDGRSSLSEPWILKFSLYPHLCCNHCSPSQPSPHAGDVTIWTWITWPGLEAPCHDALHSVRARLPAQSLGVHCPGPSPAPVTPFLWILYS